MNKRAQSAIEFLTTYAWAFIVIAIVIGAIAYFGVLTPQKVLPERCTFNVAFACQAYSLASTGIFKLRVKNGEGATIDMVKANVITEAGADFGCTFSGSVPTGWKLGEVKDLTWTGCNLATAGFVAGDKAKVLVNMTYFETAVGAGYTKLAEGEVFTTVT